MTCIAANGVLLGVPCVCPGDARWNRWTGRVVLVQHTDPPVLTIKIHGETWTIKSTQPIVGLDPPPRAWDPVNIVVDPHIVRVIWDRAAIWPHKYRWTTTHTSQTTGLVRLKGRTQDVYPTSQGHFITVAVGDVQVSALVSTPGRSWKVGTDVEVRMNEMDAWLKPLYEDVEPTPCVLAFLSGREERYG